MRVEDTHPLGVVVGSLIDRVLKHEERKSRKKHRHKSTGTSKVKGHSEYACNTATRLRNTHNPGKENSLLQDTAHTVLEGGSSSTHNVPLSIRVQRRSYRRSLLRPKVH